MTQQTYLDDIFKVVGRMFLESQIAIEKLQGEVTRLQTKYEPKEDEEAPAKVEAA